MDRHRGVRSRGPAARLERLRSDDWATFVALASGALVGALGLELRSGDAGLGMQVAADYRGQGVGSALMEAAIGWARANDAHRLSLTVFPHNHAALALYAKYGFRTEGTLRRSIRRRNGELWDAIVMGLVLDKEAPGRLGEPGGGGRFVLSPPEGGLRAGDLVLRPGRPPDAQALVTAINDPEIHRWMDEIPSPDTIEDELAYLARVRRQWTDRTGAPFVITEDRAVVGGISFRFDGRTVGLAEVSYWVARGARGRGVATKALGAVVAWAFETLGLRRIELHAAVENIASRNVAERAGFELEGVKRSWRTLHGVPTDFALYARVNHDRA